MSRCYILDGYNITAQIPSLDLKNLRGSREGLIRFVEVYRPQGSRQNKITIVFDGKPGMINQGGSLNVKVIFADDESADDRIRRLVVVSPRKKETIVVTDDKELRFSVRALGAGVMDVKDFLAKAKGHGAEALKPIKQKPRQEDEKTISKTLEYEITAEFEKIWLGRDKRKS